MPELFLPEQDQACANKSFTDITPCGSQIIVELLTAKQILGTTLSIEGSGDDIGVPVGVIRSIGPNVKPEDWGFEVGQTILIGGVVKLIPDELASKFVNCKLSIVEPNQIKAVLQQ